MRVLIVEDERQMADALRRGLEEEQHTVTVAFDGETGLELARLYDFDVVLLDVMLPHRDGLEVARRLRASGRGVPIVMVTARDATADIVRGLDAGADDYVNKPFSFAELLARLRATARRGPVPRPPTLRVADLVLDPATREVTRDGRRVRVTATEYRLLEALMRSAGRIVSRETLIETVWGIGSDVEVNTLEAFVRLLRRKVDAPFGLKLIRTVRGAGYGIAGEGGR